jgi:L-amino acid N-acyltransferase YncA
VVGFIRKDNEAPIKIVESLGWQKVGSIPRSNPSDIEWLYYVYAVPHE